MTYATISQLAFAGYFVFNHEWFWAAVWVVLTYRDFRMPPRGTDANVLIFNAILLYGLGTVWILDSMGLSKVYMNPLVLLAAVLLGVVSLVWWAIADSRKIDPTSTQNS
jgi:hypothetical protein